MSNHCDLCGLPSYDKRCVDCRVAYDRGVDDTRKKIVKMLTDRNCAGAAHLVECGEDVNS